jgi:hypothetical protein
VTVLALVLSEPPLVLALAAAYAGAGVTTAALLRRRGRPVATAASALAAWPLLLSLLGDDAAPRSTGPLARRIDGALDALEATLRHPAAGDVGTGEDTVALRASLHRADERLGLVDRLLGEPQGVDDPDVVAGLAALGAARDAAAREIEAVLAGVVQLRIQIGLVTLAGNAPPVRARLRELRARIGALDEVTRLPGDSSCPTS